MNIFFLDKDPRQAAQYLCNRHILKMGIEGLMLLSYAHYILPNEGINFDRLYPYSGRWANHPHSKWVRRSLSNYKWLWEHCRTIFDEYTYRYGKRHACVSSGKLLELTNYPTIPDIGFTFPYLGMLDDTKSDDYVESYRKYYRLHKVGKIDVRYKRRESPFWLKDLL